MEIKTLNGKRYFGTAEQILIQLKQDSWFPVRTITEWLFGLQYRARLWNHSEIRIDTAEHTVIDLIKFEILEEI